MLKRQITAVLLILAMLLAACGNSAVSEDTSDANTDTQTSDSDDEAYKFPELDCGGDEFTILNPEEYWGMYTKLDFEEMTGELIDDAVYNRNRYLEDLYNFKLNVIEFPVDELYEKIQMAVAAQ